MARKIPRGKGYDKAATLKHLKQMQQSGSFVTQYVKANGLKLDTFMLAVAAYDPGSLGYLPCHVIQNDPKLITNACGECGETFWPVRKTARFCSSKCSSAYRRDQDYFGGRRHTTLGLAEGVCGLCLRRVESGLSSHHIFGKANDPGNEHLLALCKGCHQIVSALALKKWVDDPLTLARLAVLAISQAKGAVLINAQGSGAVEVLISMPKVE